MLDRTIPFCNVILKCDSPSDTAFSLPAGFRFRMYRDGGAAEWANLEFAVGDFPSAEAAETYFRSTYCVGEVSAVEERYVFVEDSNGRTVGSCIAWQDRRGAETVASLHWLVVDPSFEGRGIRTALCGKILRIFRDRAEYPIYIHTQPWSYRAILLYLRLGFRLQKTDTFAGYENQYDQAMGILRPLLSEKQYDRLICHTDP